MERLTIREVQAVSVERSRRWHRNGIEEWSALEWAGAMAGEAGEACNAAKKLRRIELDLANINTPERSLTDAVRAREAILAEIADTVLYGVILAERVGGDLESAIRQVFNAKSEEYGFPERL